MGVTVFRINLARNDKGITKAMDLETALCVGVMREKEKTLFCTPVLLLAPCTKLEYTRKEMCDRCTIFIRIFCG